MKKFSNPYIAASRGYIDEIIIGNTRLKFQVFRFLKEKK